MSATNWPVDPLSFIYILIFIFIIYNPGQWVSVTNWPGGPSGGPFGGPSAVAALARHSTVKTGCPRVALKWLGNGRNLFNSRAGGCIFFDIVSSPEVLMEREIVESWKAKNCSKVWFQHLSDFISCVALPCKQTSQLEFLQISCFPFFLFTVLSVFLLPPLGDRTFLWGAFVNNCAFIFSSFNVSSASDDRALNLWHFQPERGQEVNIHYHQRQSINFYFACNVFDILSKFCS